MARKDFATTIDANILKALKLQAVEEDRTINDILEQAINEYLKNHVVDKYNET